MTAKSNPNIRLEGDVAPGFERVAEHLKSDLATLAENNVQLCVYVGEQRVVDLWGSAVGDATFTADTLVNIFSSGKSLESMAVAAQVGAGRLDYAARIVDYWPEFTGGGKERLTVADLMRHEAGLAAFDESIDPEHLLAANIKLNRVGEVIERQETRFRAGEGNQREYHGITRGWIVNELFRRVDAQQRTLGEFLAAELAGPLGADVMIGVPEADLSRICDVTPLGVGFFLGQSLLPAAFGRKIKHNVLQAVGRIGRVALRARGATRRGAPPPLVGMQSITVFNDRAVRMGETPSAGAHASARGLAKLAAALANGGRYDGHELLPASAWEALHAEPVHRDMGWPVEFTQGGVALYGRVGPQAPLLERAANAGREGFYGWMGFGGSIFQWHPEKRIGFSYVPTSLHGFDFLNERAKAYQSRVLDCVG